MVNVIKTLNWQKIQMIYNITYFVTINDI